MTRDHDRAPLAGYVALARDAVARAEAIVAERKVELAAAEARLAEFDNAA